MTLPFTLHWGIMATGHIARSFCRDLRVEAPGRNVLGDDVRHNIVAVASASRSAAQTEEFISWTLGSVHNARAYESCAELVRDPNVDIVYVASAYSHHFQNAMLALQAGKHVLCEKPLTVTAAQARVLVSVARSQNLFLMEAVWTRCFPLTLQVADLVRQGAIGKVHRVIADCSVNLNSSEQVEALIVGDTARLVNPNLAGGVLFDFGLYALSWVYLLLYHVVPPVNRENPRVSSALKRYQTGVDESATLLVHFQDSGAVGIAMASSRVDGNDEPSVHVQGSHGEIQVMGSTYRPTGFRLIRHGHPDEDVAYPVPAGALGLFWEADECARCIRDGRSESPAMPLEESVLVLEQIGFSLRDAGIVFPDLVTTDLFDPHSPLNVGFSLTEQSFQLYGSQLGED